MQNISLNKLEKIEKTNNKSIDELKQVAKIRDIKDYQDMSKEDLLITLFKSSKSHRELQKSKYNNTETEDTKKIFNELRNNFSRKKNKNIRRNFYLKERIPCKCISMIMRDSVIKANKKYYPQMLLEECKYLQEKIKKLKIILTKN